MGFLRDLFGFGQPTEQEIQECLIDNSNRCFSNRDYCAGGYASGTSDFTALDKKREAELDAEVKRALINAGVDFEANAKFLSEHNDWIHKKILKRQAEDKKKREEEIEAYQNLIDSNKQAVDNLVNGNF